MADRSEGAETPTVPIDPEKQKESHRLRDLGSGGRTEEATTQQLNAMRAELKTAMESGDQARANRIRDNLELVEKKLGL